MWRLRCSWTGSGVVGPGVSTFYALDTSPGFPAAVRAFLNSQAGSYPAGTSIQVPNNGDVLDPATGALTGSWTDGSTPAVITGTGSGGYAAGVGAQVRWKTAGIVNGRRCQGSTFLVPQISATYDAQGTIASVQLTSMQTAAQAYITAAPYAVVWSRPYAGDTTPGHVRPPRAGSTHLITAFDVPDRVSWLRSRRT